MFKALTFENIDPSPPLKRTKNQKIETPRCSQQNYVLFQKNLKLFQDKKFGEKIEELGKTMSPPERDYASLNRYAVLQRGGK